MNNLFSYNKYNVAPAKDRIYNGRLYASKSEKEWGMVAQSLLLQKKISELKLQKSFILQPKYVAANGRKIRQMEYVCDFYFYDEVQKRYRVIDVKGFKTASYRIKEKLFNYKYQKKGLYIEYTI